MQTYRKIVQKINITGSRRNWEFAEQLQKRHQIQQTNDYWENLIYLNRKKPASQVDIHKNLSQFISNSFYQKIRQYEEKYYRVVTNQDNRRFLHTMERIYNQPGEKKQLVHLLRKFGIVTREQKEWKDHTERLKRYEEELVLIQKQIMQQEEYLVRLKTTEIRPQFTAEITHEVMQNIKKEIRLERLRHGMD